MTECANFIQEEILKSTTTSEIIDKLVSMYGISRDAARKRIARVRSNVKTQVAGAAAVQANPQTANMQPGQVKTTSTTINANGEKIFEDLIRCFAGNQVKPEDLMKAHNLDPAEWEVTSMKSSLWESQFSDGSTGVMESVKLAVKPRAAGSISFSDVDRYFAKKQYKLVPLPKVVPVKKKNGYVVEICIPDMHVGLLAWKKETGEDFDLNLVKKQYTKALDNIIRKLMMFSVPIKEIVVATLGDLLHVDNDMQQTTKGTFQQVDGRLAKISDTALEMMEETIMKLEQLAPVSYVYVAGNHDRVLGYMVAVALQRSFKNHKNVTFDIEPNPHKYRIIGKAMVGWSHGDMNKKNIDTLLYNIADDQTGVRYRCLHLGHLHNSMSHTTPDGKVFVEYLNSLCPASYWEHQQGYGSCPKRYLNAFLWDGSDAPPERIIGAVE